MTKNNSPIFRFLKLMRPEASEIRLIFLFSIVAGTFSLALPLAVTSFINTLGFGVRNMPFIQMLIVLILVLFASLGVSGIMRLAQYYLIEIIQRRIFVRLASDLSYRLPRVCPEAYGKNDGPELVNRFFEIILMQKTVSTLFLQGLNLLLNASVGVILLSFYHPFLLAFVILTGLALLFIVIIAGRKGMDTAIEESDAKYRVMAWVEQLAAFPRMFKFEAALEYARQRIDQTMGDYIDARTRHFKILMRQIILLITVEVLASVALLGIGGILVLDQQLTVGQLVASEIILATLLTSIAKLGKQFEAWYDTMAAMNKLGYLIDLKPLSDEGDSDSIDESAQSHIEVKSLGASFHDGMYAFQDMNFRVAPGQKMAVKGHPSGQLALLEVIAGLKSPNSGFLKIGGRRIDTWHPLALNRELLFLRERQLFDGTLRQNLTFGRDNFSLHKIQECISLAGLSHYVDHHPDGLDSRVISQGKNLSNEEGIRIIIARALLHQPRILLIDNILENLPSDDRHYLAKILTSQSWTLLICSHDPKVHELCDSVFEPSCNLQNLTGK